MDIRKIFNIILLALSLSTIFITLISYIIFKLRQASSSKANKDQYDLEGAYFRRYAPELEKINEDKKKENLAASGSVKRKYIKFFGLAIFVFLMIFTVLMFEDYFKYRTQVKAKISSAKDFKKLIASGLLQKHEYNPYHGPIRLEEKLSKAASGQLKSIQDQLKNQAFCMISNLRSKKESARYHIQANRNWRNFFKRNKLKLTAFKNLKETKGCFWIFPHIHEVNTKDVALVKKILEMSPSIVTGQFNIGEKPQSKGRNAKLASVFEVNPMAENKVTATVINSEVDRAWEIPSGKLLNWHPIDQSAAFIESPEMRALLSANFDGWVIEKSSNSKVSYRSRILQNKKIIWSALDPLEGTVGENEYTDLVLLSLIGNLLDKPQVKIANLRDQESVPINLVVNITDPGHDIKLFVKRLNGLGVPYTLGSHASYLAGDEGAEDLVKVEDSLLMVSREVADKSLKELFDYFENERFGLEETTRDKISGFISSDGQFNETVLTALDLNHINYVYGGKKINTFDPVFLKLGQIMYYPRNFKNSYEIMKDSSLGNETDIYSYILQEYNQAQSISSPYVFSVDNSSFKNPIFEKVLLKLIKEKKPYFQSLSQSLNWYIEKDKILKTIKFIDGKWEIELRNSSSKETGEFKLHIFHQNKKSTIKIPSLKSGAQFNHSLT